MSDKILHKRSLTTGSIPTTGDLEYGELAINVADGAIYLKKSGSSGDSIESAVITNSTSSGDININGSVFATTVETENFNVNADTLIITGSILVDGQIETTGITGSLQGTADTASYVDWNNVDNKPTVFDGTVFNSYTQSTDSRLDSIETESGSVRSELNTYTSSTDNRISLLETESGSIRIELNAYTSSTDSRLNSLETVSGSVFIQLSNIENFTSSQNELNQTFATTGSNIFNGNQTINGDLIIDGDLTAKNFYIDSASVIYTSGSTKFGDTIDDIHEFTGSVKITGSLELNGIVVGSDKINITYFNSYTQSLDSRLNSLETESGSIRTQLSTYTQSTDLRLQSLETESGSVRTEFNSYTSSNDTLNNGQDNRLSLLEIESGSIRTEFNSYTQSITEEQTEQNNRLSSLEIESGSVRTELNNYTQSANNRLDLLSTESGSIRSTVNTYTQSNDLRVQSLEIESSSVKGRLGNIEQFSSSQLILNPTFATTGSNTFIGSQIISGSVIQSGSFTVNGLQYPNVSDGEFTFFQHDGNGNITLQYVETLYETVYNATPSQILKGTPLYVSGSEGANARVFPAEASDPTKMPVIYIAADNIEPATEGRGILLGLITGVDTTGYGPGTEVFVAPNGGWTAVRPTGSAIVQTLGIVTKEGNGGQGVVLNPGPNSIPNLNSGHFWIGNGNWLPTPIPTASFTSTASFNEYTSSTNDRLNQLSTESGSIRSTLNSYSQSTNLRLDTIESETSSYARIDADNVFSKLQTFTNINVNGTASFAYIQSVTGSSTSIGDSFIILNENTPAQNFAGIKVVDSGSSFTTASFIYDGLNNNWVFQHEGSESSGSSLAIFGPLSQGGLGTEVGLTENRIPKVVTDHGHHIGDSSIIDDGEKVQIDIPLNVTTDITASTVTATTFIGSFSGTTDTASYVEWNNVDKKPTLVSQSTFDTFQTATNNRLSTLETETGSIYSSLANIRSFTESIDLRVGKLEVESGSIRSTFNSYTSSTDDRISHLETESGSVQNRLNTIENFTSSQIDINTSLQSFTSSIDTTIKTKLDVETVISSSTQIRTLTYYREDVGGDLSYTVNHNLNELYPIVQVYESGSNEQVIPLKVKSNSVNQILVEFTNIFSGSIIVKS